MPTLISVPPYLEKTISSPLVQVHGDVLSVVVPAARADGEDAAALRLFLRRIRKHDAAERLLLFFEDFDDQPVTKRLQVHSVAS